MSDEHAVAVGHPGPEQDRHRRPADLPPGHRRTHATSTRLIHRARLLAALTTATVVVEAGRHGTAPPTGAADIHAALNQAHRHPVQLR
jgi:hypothetical protein